MVSEMTEDYMDNVFCGEWTPAVGVWSAIDPVKL